MDAARELHAAARSGLITSEQVNAHRAAIDARKWAASKLRPKVYGDRLDIALEHRAELVVLDYGRSDPARGAIDVTPNKSLALPAGEAPAPRKPKRTYSRRELAAHAKRREAKRKANAAAHRKAQAEARRELARRTRPRGGRG